MSNLPDWEEKLVRVAADGDTGALGALLARHTERLREDLKFEIGPHLSEVYSADDAVQDASDHALRNFSQFTYRGPGSFYAWFKQVAKHRAIDAARARDAAKRGGQAQRVRVNDAEASRFVDSVDALRHDSETPSRTASRQELLEAIRVALLQLNPNEREVVVLRYLQGHEWTEVAERLKTTVPSARSVAHRAFDKLKETLGSMSRYLGQG